MSTLAKNKRSCSKSGKFQAKFAFFLFFRRKIGTRFCQFGNDRLSREGALGVRESREWRDIIFAEKTENAKELDQSFQWGIQNFHFFGR